MLRRIIHNVLECQLLPQKVALLKKYHTAAYDIISIWFFWEPMSEWRYSWTLGWISPRTKTQRAPQTQPHRCGTADAKMFNEYHCLSLAVPKGSMYLSSGYLGRQGATMSSYWGPDVWYLGRLGVTSKGPSQYNVPRTRVATSLPHAAAWRQVKGTSSYQHTKGQEAECCTEDS